jgi:hypothetical protein
MSEQPGDQAARILRQMFDEAKRDEAEQSPTASVYKAYRLAQHRETIGMVAERLGVDLYGGGSDE